PRHLFDASVGDDDRFHGDHYKWSLRLTVINLTNKTALYNFLSTFSGTHFVTPRSYRAELGLHFYPLATGGNSADRGGRPPPPGKLHEYEIKMATKFAFRI